MLTINRPIIQILTGLLGKEPWAGRGMCIANSLRLTVMRLFILATFWQQPMAYFFLISIVVLFPLVFWIAEWLFYSHLSYLHSYVIEHSWRKIYILELILCMTFRYHSIDIKRCCYRSLCSTMVHYSKVTADWAIRNSLNKIER